jgi:glycosyltransferase involved in cell wall biosynthesis
VAEQRFNGHSTLQRWTGSHVARHVSVSPSVAIFAEHFMQLEREKLVVIPNGIDLARFCDIAPVPPAELGPPNRRMILFLGRLESEKRPAWLLDRFAAMSGQLPHHDLVLAGRGPLEGKLKLLARRLRVADRVHFIGWRSDVSQLLAATDLVLLTSASEGMPNVVLEAMAGARPAVATAAHGVEELLGTDADGHQAVPLNAEAAFVEAVVGIASDPRLAARLGDRNRDRVAANFSLERTSQAYVELYDHLLGIV